MPSILPLWARITRFNVSSTLVYLQVLFLLFFVPYPRSLSIAAPMANGMLCFLEPSMVGVGQQPCSLMLVARRGDEMDIGMGWGWDMAEVRACMIFVFRFFSFVLLPCRFGLFFILVYFLCSFIRFCARPPHLAAGLDVSSNCASLFRFHLILIWSSLWFRFCFVSIPVQYPRQLINAFLCRSLSGRWYCDNCDHDRVLAAVVGDQCKWSYEQSATRINQGI